MSQKKGPKPPFVLSNPVSSPMEDRLLDEESAAAARYESPLPSSSTPSTVPPPPATTTTGEGGGGGGAKNSSSSSSSQVQIPPPQRFSAVAGWGNSSIGSLSSDDDAFSADSNGMVVNLERRASVNNRIRDKVASAYRKTNGFQWWAKKTTTYSETYESLDYDTIFHPGYVKENEKSGKKKVWGYTGATFVRWTFTALVGIVLGCSARGLEICVKNIVSERSRILQSILDKGSFSSPSLIPAYFFLVGLNLVLCMFAAGITVFIEPSAAGSGIAQVKAYLNGTHIPDVFRLRTIVVKFVGIILAVSSGLAVGPEGPMVHTGAGIASGLTRGDKVIRLSSKNESTLRIQSPLLSKFHNDKDRRDFICAGSAAGLAAAFGAPIGGVLFALEEASSFWSPRLTWRCFVCTIVTTFTLAALKAPYFSSLSTSGLLSFGNEAGNSNNKNNSGGGGGDGHESQQLAMFGQIAFWEIVPFVLIAIVGGVLGAVWNAMYGASMKIRPKNKIPKMVEVACVSFFTTTIVMFLPYFFHSCEPSSEENPGFRFYCGEGEQNGMASIFFGLREESILRLFTTQESLSEINLGVAGTTFYILMFLSSGLSLPAGLFMPTIMTGACFGRIAGQYAQGFSSEVFPGAYALIGSTALLGGIQRSSISLCVIIIEGTSNIHFLLPIVITSIISQYVGNLFNESLYDIGIHLNHIPFLEPEPSHRLYRRTARSCMVANPDCFYAIEKVGNLVSSLKKTRHGGFLVVCCADGSPTQPQNPRDGMRFQGIILRWQLRAILKLARKHDVPTLELGPGKRPMFKETEDVWEEFKHRHRSKARPFELLVPESEFDKYVDLTPYMNPATITVMENCPLMRVYMLFRTLGLRHLPVVGLSNEVVGLVTRIDLINHWKDAPKEEDETFSPHATGVFTGRLSLQNAPPHPFSAPGGGGVESSPISIAPPSIAGTSIQ